MYGMGRYRRTLSISKGKLGGSVIAQLQNDAFACTWGDSIFLAAKGFSFSSSSSSASLPPLFCRIVGSASSLTLGAVSSPVRLGILPCASRVMASTTGCD